MRPILSKSVLKRLALSEYGAGTNWQNLELVDMTEAIKTERAAEKQDVQKIEEMEKDLLRLKNEVAWEEARCLLEIKAAPEKITKNPGLVGAVKNSIQESKERIKAYKAKFDRTHQQLYGKPFYSVSRVIISESLRRK